MKFVCFGYLDVESWAKKSPGEQHAMMDRCFAYDEVLKKNGHWAGGEALQSATTIGQQAGKTYVTDGPYAETKEQMGGFWVIEAADLDAALDWAGQCAAACEGPVELRPMQVEPEAEV